jgi:hypothetical protein
MAACNVVGNWTADKRREWFIVSNGTPQVKTPIVSGRENRIAFGVERSYAAQMSEYPSDLRPVCIELMEESIVSADCKHRR